MPDIYLYNKCVFWSLLPPVPPFLLSFLSCVPVDHWKWKWNKTLNLVWKRDSREAMCLRTGNSTCGLGFPSYDDKGAYPWWNRNLRNWGEAYGTYTHALFPLYIQLTDAFTYKDTGSLPYHSWPFCHFPEANLKAISFAFTTMLLNNMLLIYFLKLKKYIIFFFHLAITCFDSLLC